jgi:hypothetical protein
MSCDGAGLESEEKAMRRQMTRMPGALAVRTATQALLGLAMGVLLAPAVRAQEVLPFNPAPSASTPGLTIQDSTYRKRVEPKRLAEGAPNILIILMDDVGPGTPSAFAGEASQYEPTMVRNTTYVSPHELHRDGYHLTEDIAEDAIKWLREQKVYAPD